MSSEVGTAQSDDSIIWAGGVDTGNANPFTGGQACGNFGPRGPRAFTQNDTRPFAANGAFAMEYGLTMTSTAAGQQFNGYYGVGAIPEVGSTVEAVYVLCASGRTWFCKLLFLKINESMACDLLSSSHEALWS
jgi:hypothetical protein